LLLLFFFCASSYLRFPSNQRYFPGLSDVKNVPQHRIHQHVCNYYRKLLSQESTTTIYPFTIKKGSNIYGLIFGAHHIRAVDKFLQIAWKLNPVNGQANFDINEDIGPQQLKLGFDGDEIRRKTKLEAFKEDLSQRIVNSKLCTNKAVYLYTLGRGFLPSHAREVVSDLKKQKIIEYGGRSPYITYDQIYHKHNIMPIKVLK